MTPFLAFILMFSVLCGVLALLGWAVEKMKDNPLERFERRWPVTKGWER